MRNAVECTLVCFVHLRFYVEIDEFEVFRIIIITDTRADGTPGGIVKVELGPRFAKRFCRYVIRIFVSGPRSENSVSASHLTSLSAFQLCAERRSCVPGVSRIHPVRTYLGKAIGIIPNEQFHAQLFIVFRQIVVGDIGVRARMELLMNSIGDLIFRGNLRPAKRHSLVSLGRGWSALLARYSRPLA